YSFISCRPELVGDAVGQIVKLALKRGFAKDDIQVLSAMYLGNGGVTNLNNVIQAILNPSQPKSKVLEAHNEVFRIGDRILQLQNNPEKDIYNGQIGKIISIDEDDANECMIADFDGREVVYKICNHAFIGIIFINANECMIADFDGREVAFSRKGNFSSIKICN